MKKRNVMLALLLIVYTMSHAQMQQPKSYDASKAIQFYFGIGAAHANHKNLNNALLDADLPSVGNWAMSSIAEVDLRHNNFLIGLTSNMNFSPKRNDDYNTSLMSLYGGLNVGYYIVNASKFHLAPQVGIGYNAAMAKITKRSGYAGFNDVLSHRNSIDLNQGVPVLDFALKFDCADFTKTATHLTGVRLGYKLGLDKRGWGIDETSNSTLNNSPEDRLSQFYAMVTIGFALQKPNK
jgi:hypothetical protein